MTHSGTDDLQNQKVKTESVVITILLIFIIIAENPITLIVRNASSAWPCPVRLVRSVGWFAFYLVSTYTTKIDAVGLSGIGRTIVETLQFE